MGSNPIVASMSDEPIRVHTYRKGIPNYTFCSGFLLGALGGMLVSGITIRLFGMGGLAMVFNNAIEVNLRIAAALIYIPWILIPPILGVLISIPLYRMIYRWLVTEE